MFVSYLSVLKFNFWKEFARTPVHILGTDGVVEVVIGDCVGMSPLPIVPLLRALFNGTCHLVVVVRPKTLNFEKNLEKICDFEQHVVVVFSQTPGCQKTCLNKQ